MPIHIDHFTKTICACIKEHWHGPIKHAAVISVLLLSAGLILACCSELLVHNNWLRTILHLPAWAGKPYFNAPFLDAQSAILLDLDSSRIIYEKKIYERMYPASTTKILTALVAIENSDPNEIVTVGREIYLAPRDGSKAGLYEGEKILMRDVIFGLMLPSGNDAAYVIAAHIARKRLGVNRSNMSKSISFFVKIMNQRAKKAGARMSHFTNPDGYHDPNHYSTAYDLSIIAKEAMKLPLFRRVVKSSTYSRFTPEGNWGRNRKDGRLPPYGFKQTVGCKQMMPDSHICVWENRNLLLDPLNPFYFPEANGIKTGHTAEAGYCLVVSASRQGEHLIAVVLMSTQTGVWNDATILLNHGFTGR
jgi:serine-type D-Ala-D-Ala carboxypeptidase (penicillin-binding protein 5/6)